MENKITKTDIENLALELSSFLQEKGLHQDVCIYYNDKRLTRNNEGRINIEFDISPMDYFEYVNPHHILSCSFEGPLYYLLNYYSGSEETREAFTDILKKYNCFMETGEAWNFTCYPIDDSIDMETTEYEVHKEPIYIYDKSDNSIPWQLRQIMEAWWKLSKDEGDIGGCVLGAGFKFKWNDKEYFMGSQSPWQGSCSWEKWIDTVKSMLILIGAEEIHYNYGNLD